MENTGATKCLLILEKAGERFVKARAVIDSSSGSKKNSELALLLSMLKMNSKMNGWGLFNRKGESGDQFEGLGRGMHRSVSQSDQLCLGHS